MEGQEKFDIRIVLTNLFEKAEKDIDGRVNLKDLINLDADLKETFVVEEDCDLEDFNLSLTLEELLEKFNNFVSTEEEEEESEININTIDSNEKMISNELNVQALLYYKDTLNHMKVASKDIQLSLITFSQSFSEYYQRITNYVDKKFIDFYNMHHEFNIYKKEINDLINKLKKNEANLQTRLIEQSHERMKLEVIMNNHIVENKILTVIQDSDMDKNIDNSNELTINNPTLKERNQSLTIQNKLLNSSVEELTTRCNLIERLLKKANHKLSDQEGKINKNSTEKLWVTDENLNDIIIQYEEKLDNIAEYVRKLLDLIMNNNPELLEKKISTYI